MLSGLTGVKVVNEPELHTFYIVPLTQRDSWFIHTHRRKLCGRWPPKREDTITKS